MSSTENHPALSRRTLLQTAAVVPAVGMTLPALGGTAHAAQAAARGGFDADSARFTVVVIPDTQYLYDADSADPAPLQAALRHVLADRATQNTAFLAHLGDITEHGTTEETSLAARTFRTIHGSVPYSVLAGNHDIAGKDDQRGDSPYLQAFGPHRMESLPSFLGASPGGYNTCHLMRAAGREWLVLALDWRVSDTGLNWARQVLDRHKHLPTILTTHDVARADDTGAAALSPHGQRLWEGLVRDRDQVFLVLGGHYWPPGRTVLRNASDNDVHIHITNYQDRYYGGAGMIRTYSFDMARNVIDVATYSPWLLGKDARQRTPLEAETVELTGAVDRFSLEIDFNRRFSGFAPIAPPAPRPASRVLVRGTAAYWRFDAAGAQDGVSVVEGTVFRDLSGNGNDLTAKRLHSSEDDALTWSTDHHLRQPAHASLRFDGGKTPDRGAVLSTSPRAALNQQKFTRGYTIETFFKLPEPFEGDHAWMGLLSWEGRSGDAGKTTGWSPEEPTCSLNLSGERFVQFVVYPHVQDADPTSWSHAVPVGRWTHVAVVNDGRRTTMYLDGSKIARNPTQPSTGIATLGKPFVIGATQFAEKFGQGFYGWIGDTRIVSRALRPQEFLIGDGTTQGGRP